MKRLLLLFTIAAYVAVVNSSYASHAAAVDLTYQCLGGNQYKFVLKLYRDCSGSSLGGSFSINLRSTSCSQNFNLTVNRDSIREVSQLCGTSISSSSCNGGSLPGIQEHTYSGTVTLPATCSDWVGSFDLCCRNNAITNINNADLYTEVRIDNTGGKCNNSPIFNSGIPILYACAGDPINFNNGAFDMDGDSLTYQLVQPLSDPGVTIPYTSGAFSPTNPMTTTSGFTFNSLTGQITFTTNTLQQAVVSVLIREYDSLGNLRGSIRRDIQFIILNCPPLTPPKVTGVNYDSINYTFKACYTDSFCFNVFGTSGQPGIGMKLNYNGGIPGGTFDTIIRNDTTFGTFCWNPGIATGSYNFTIRGEANVCPITRVNVFSYTVVIDTNFTVCRDSTIYLDQFGMGLIDSTYVIGTHSSICQIQNVTLNKTNINCSDIGINSVTVTTHYTNGTTKTCTSTVTVLDTIPPNILCKDTAIYLNTAGNKLIDSSFINNGTTDNCSLQNIWLSKTSFNCSNVGNNSIKMFARDIYGNIDSCNANVIVIDSIKPTPVWKDTTIYLSSAGTYTIDSSYINNGSYDNCGIQTISLSKYNFTCTDVGLNSISMIVTDINGNTNTSIANVTVIDSVKPTPICKDTAIYLNTSGNFTIDSSFINNGSFDNCGISLITLSKYAYNCSNIGVNAITMLVTDVNGNSNSCNANITVIDTIKPSPICKDTTIYLNTSGNFTIDSSFINNGSFDNCNISTITLSQYSFNCSHVGLNPIRMVVRDVNGNIDSCNANVIVIDSIKPTPVWKDTTIYLSSAGTYSIDSSYINNGSYDNCGIQTITLSKYNFTCTDVGVNSISMVVTDINGNTNTIIANVIVIDSVKPTPICKDTAIYLNTSGNFTIDSSFINNGSFDNCEISLITLSKYAYNCSNIGVNAITMLVTDVNGNSNSCNANITVIDTIKPTPICKDTTIYLNTSGNFTIDSSFINNGSFDNCNIATITLSQYDFTCSHIGLNPIRMVVRDVNGNIDSCNANVMVVDTVNPNAICIDTTIYLNASGNFTIDSTYVDGGSSDACGVYTLSQSYFDCSHIGANSVTLYVNDPNTNSDSCLAIVNVMDTVKPNVICRNAIIYLNVNGQFTIDSSYINNGSNDACGIASITLSKYTYHCIDLGVNTITMYVTDINGNSDSCTASITVMDTIIPYVNAGPDDSLCAIYTHNMAANMPTGTYTGSWNIVISPNSPVVSNTTLYNASVSNLIEGQYLFEWVISNGNGCIVSRDTMNLYIFDEPVSNAGTDTSLCNSYSLTLDANIPAGLSIGNWSYLSPSPSTPVFSNSSMYNSTVSNLVEGIYSLVWTVTNGNCLSVKDTIQIKVYDAPYAYGGPNINLCNSYSAFLIANTPVGSSSGIWSTISGPNTPTFGSANNPVTVITNLIEGSYQIQWTVSNGNCTPARDTLIINVYNQPIANAGPDTNLCAVYNLNLYANQPLGTSTGRWMIDPSSSSPSTPVFTDSSVYNTTLSNLQEGTYRLLWIVSNGVCTPTVDTVIIRVWDQPVAYAGVDSNLCGIYSYQFNADPVTGLSQGIWRLDASNANPNTPNFVNSTSNTGSVTGLVEGTYRFIWDVTNGPCFHFTDTLSITVYDVPYSNAGPNQDLCNEISTLISAVPPAGLSKGIWKLANGFPNNPTFIDSVATTNISSMIEGGIYTLYWETTNGTCPANRDTIIIHNHYVPIAQFTEDTTQICAGDCVQFTDQSIINGGDQITQYYWSSASTFSSNSNPSICYPTSGIYDVKLIVESNYGCKDTITKTSLIEVFTLPIADFNVYLVDDPDVSTKIQIQNQSQHAVTHWYSMGDGFTYTDPSFYHIYADSGLYDITQIVSNTFGCKDTLKRTIFVHVLIVYVPNAFTPDKNNVNEIFIPFVDGDDPSGYLLRIFDRWGELIFQTQDKSEGWNGTYKEYPAPTGTYNWILRAKYRDGERVQDFRGYVNLLR